MSNKSQPELFSAEWGDQLVKLWNHSESRQVMAGFGTAQFVVVGGSNQVIYFHWDRHAQLKRLADGVKLKQVISFTATGRDWQSFMQQKFSATMGVLSGKIKYSGSLKRILPFSSAFNQFARIANKINA